MQEKTLTRWSQFLGAIAVGEGLPDSKKKYLITNADIEACCRHDPAEAQKFNEACIAGRKSAWSVLQFQEFFGRIAEGKTIEQAQIEVLGYSDRRMGELINMDAGLHEQYLRALEARAYVVVEPIIDMIEDRSRDTLAGPKGGEIPNMAAVSRDKNVADIRLRVAGLYNRKVFGEKVNNQVNVQIINHAETLEAARDRAKLRDKRVTPQQMKNAIDAAFSEKPEAPAETWVDEPIDTVWREET